MKLPFRLAATLSSILFLAHACALPPDSSSSNQTRVPTSNPGSGRTSVLIYNGASAWQPEIESLQSILFSHQESYQTVDQATLDSMSIDDLTRFNLIIFPGGDAPTMTQGMQQETRARIRTAVQEKGLNYLGFCAGAWMAVAPPPEPGEDAIYGLGVVSGPVQEQTYLFKQGKHFDLIRASFPDGRQRELLWYGGPITPNIPGGVVAKYSDGTPAITQIHSGKGFAILSGLHPTANRFILNSLGLRSSDAIAPELAWQMIDSAIHQTPMPAF